MWRFKANPGTWNMKEGFGTREAAKKYRAAVRRRYIQCNSLKETKIKEIFIPH